jgi:hypothetical protein
MYTFFYGWRRKAGCVSLVIALVSTGMWIRSTRFQDAWDFQLGSTSHDVLSQLGTIYWHRTFDLEAEYYFKGPIMETLLASLTIKATGLSPLIRQSFGEPFWRIRPVLSLIHSTLE